MQNDLNPSDGAAPPPALLNAVAKILRPLVRLMLANQLTYPQLSALLKQLYVTVADEEFGVDHKRQSDSRINLLTGVHRKDVKRLRAEPQARAQQPGSVSLGARIIGHWLGTAEFLNTDNQPLPLPVKATAGAPSFEALVQTVSRQDIRPKVILDEWLRLGVASLDEENRVILNTGAFTPEKGFEEKAYFFGKNLQDHISAGAHNLLGKKPSYFDRSVYYDGLSAGSVARLTALADNLGMKALTEMNKAALAFQEQDKNSSSAPHRINFGVFNYSTPVERPAAPPDSSTEPSPHDA
ncbi:MAG: hypothetical protein RLZZ385_2031 [Pseudomonadota bacterium]|jgi:hypothetical protein